MVVRTDRMGENGKEQKRGDLALPSESAVTELGWTHPARKGLQLSSGFLN